MDLQVRLERLPNVEGGTDVRVELQVSLQEVQRRRVSAASAGTRDGHGAMDLELAAGVRRSLDDRVRSYPVWIAS